MANQSWVPNWDKMSREEIGAMQNQLLRDFIRYQVYPYSPYYRRVFDENKLTPDDIQTTDDLVKLPFSSKENIAPTAENPAKFVEVILQPDEEKIKKYAPKGKLIKLLFTKMTKGEDEVKKSLEWEYKPIHLHFTTGRTAMPTPFGYSAYDLERFKESTYRLFLVFGLSRDDVAINAFPYAPHMAFWAGFFGCIACGVTSLQTGGGKAMGTERLMGAIERLRATVVIVIPGYGYHLLREAAKKGMNFSNIHTIIFGGERVPPGLKDKCVDLLKQMGAKSPRVQNTYACTESRVAWGECRPKPEEPSDVSYGYHTYPDMEFFEIINPKTGERVGEGEEGEIVYTNLNGRGSIVLRYRTGDLAKDGIVYSPCPNCGRTTPRIMSNITRSSEFKEFNLSKVKGTLVDLNAFFPLLMGHPDVLEWQIEIRKKNDDPFEVDEIHLFVAPKGGVNKETLKADLNKLIISETEVAPNRIEILELSEMLAKLGMETEVKELRIVDKRPKT